MATFIRKDAWKLSAISTWEPTLLWYAKAVGDMSSRAAKDPTSWRFQAGVHGYNKTTDPFVKSGPVPSGSEVSKFWSKCQHGSWFFLPWHRMYLGFFEEIVRAAIVKLGGPKDWALPYWNYSDTSNPNARALPPAFRQKNLPDGSPNPLYVIQGIGILRAPGIVTGTLSVIPPQDVDLSHCLSETFFSPSTDTTVGDLGFGGPAIGLNHDGQFFGQKSVENVPHNAIHVDVGGETTNGWMLNPDTAALDPIFWFHHANIDRLWSVWNRTSNSNTDPTVPVNVGGKRITWETSIKFTFRDLNGHAVTMKPIEVKETATTRFQYDYDDAIQPIAAAAASRAATGQEEIMKSQPRSEMVGASRAKIALTGSAQTTTFTIAQPSGPAKARVEAAKAPSSGKVYLVIENVKSKESHATYGVYVDLPTKPSASDYEQHYAGAMHLFGVRHASKRSKQHAGNGLTFSLDITNLVGILVAKKEWDDKNVRVSFVPRGSSGEAINAIAKHDPIQIGRVSVYRA
jgi:tyrosinase